MRKLIVLILLPLMVSCLEHKPPESSSTNTSATVEPETTVVAEKHNWFKAPPKTTYFYDSLSTVYDYEVVFCRDPKNEESNCFFEILIKSKEGNVMDSIVTDSFFYEGRDYEAIQEVRSYVTRFNTKLPIVDDYYGYLVVADFNGDKLEDFAVMRSIESNAGPKYVFYIQGKDNQFEIDTFLTNAVAYFPDFINNGEIKLKVRAWNGAIYCSNHVWKKKIAGWVTIFDMLVDFSERRNGLENISLNHQPNFMEQQRAVFVGADINKERRILHGLELDVLEDSKLKYKLYERIDFKSNWMKKGVVNIDPMSVNWDKYYIYDKKGKKHPAYRLVEFRADSSKLEILITKKTSINSSFARVFEIIEKEGIEDPINDLTYLLHAK